MPFCFPYFKKCRQERPDIVKVKKIKLLLSAVVCKKYPNAYFLPNATPFYAGELSLGSSLKINNTILLIIFSWSDACHFRKRTL